MQHFASADRWRFPAVIVLVVTVMILPLPSNVLDLLLVANISTAVLILLVSTNVQQLARLLLVPVTAARRDVDPHRIERVDIARRALDRRRRRA